MRIKVAFWGMCVLISVSHFAFALGPAPAPEFVNLVQRDLDPVFIKDLAVQAQEEWDQRAEQLGPEGIQRLALEQYNPMEVDPLLPQGRVDPQKAVEAYAVQSTVERFEDLLDEHYPGQMLQGNEYIFSHIGVARLKVKYCSPTAYLAIYGTVLPQEAFSGAYGTMDVYDIMITGKMESHAPGQWVPTEYKNGDTSFLRRGEGRHFNMSANAYMADLGVGVVPLAFGQGVLFPGLTSFDWRSISVQIGDCVNSVFRNLGLSIHHWIQGQ